MFAVVKTMKNNGWNNKKALICIAAVVMAVIAIAAVVNRPVQLEDTIGQSPESGGSQTVDLADTVRYKGKMYTAVEYPANVFCYDYNGNDSDNFDEPDGIYPIKSPKWDIIWNGGDLYCISDCVDEANAYYADDENYEWYVQIDAEDDESDAYPIKVTAAESAAVCDLETEEKDIAVYFDEFEKLGSIFKVSRDGIVRGTISVGKYDGRWYWRSEIIDESRECDGTWPEYIQPLPETLDTKIKKGD